MAIISQQIPEIISAPRGELSTEDKTILSQKINEISELIYIESQYTQAYKGYLSVFRNMTDSQELADKVLARLAIG